MKNPDLILASASAARLRLLTNAGFACVARPSDVDETAIKNDLRAQGASVDAVALALARAKAEAASPEDGSTIVIAADQMLASTDRWLDKAPDRAAAAGQLMRLQGRVHELVVGCVVWRKGTERWSVVTRAALTMRALTAGEIEAYLDCVGDAACASVGGYAIEGEGVRLFSKIEGDFFTIQGLPLLELSGFLHSAGFGFAAQ
ncbi:MAG: Maf family protein [Pseudomonadota bacterium]